MITSITSNFDVEHEKDAIKRIPVGGLAKHWTLFHILTLAALEVHRSELRRAGSDDITGLKIFEVKRKKRNVVKLESIDSAATYPPLAAWVNDDGQFTAVYGQEEVDDLVKLGAVLSSTKLNFTNRPWKIPVYEVFSYLPKTLVIGKYGAYGVDEDLEITQTVAVYSDFPCGVIHEDVKIVQPTTWNRDEYQQHDVRNWWMDQQHQSYRHIPHIPTEPAKSMCAYDAAADYLEKILGITMSFSDRAWYKENDLVKPEGLPLECTLSVLTELVLPYRVEIDRVWVGEFAWSDELGEFASALKLDDELYRMARSIKPGLPEPRMFRGVLPELEPVVMFTKSATSPYPSGHASFLSSRSARPAVWTMALTYRRQPWT